MKGDNFDWRYQIKRAPELDYDKQNHPTTSRDSSRHDARRNHSKIKFYGTLIAAPERNFWLKVQIVAVEYRSGWMQERCIIWLPYQGPDFNIRISSVPHPSAGSAENCPPAVFYLWSITTHQPSSLHLPWNACPSEGHLLVQHSIASLLANSVCPCPTS